tara:strand:+ start:240 stop:755 length:516 start_codon:yes stop_codon:yes gene_type:complete
MDLTVIEELANKHKGEWFYSGDGSLSNKLHKHFGLTIHANKTIQESKTVGSFTLSRVLLPLTRRKGKHIDRRPHLRLQRVPAPAPERKSMQLPLLARQHGWFAQFRQDDSNDWQDFPDQPTSIASEENLIAWVEARLAKHNVAKRCGVRAVYVGKARPVLAVESLRIGPAV